MNYGVDPEDNQLKILEQNHYYPFGLKHTNYNVDKRDYKKDEENPELLKMPQLPVDESIAYNYKYNSKEWQDELGLNMYDYGARNYDPAIGRWMNIDPLAEKGRRWSPYNYCMDNPVYFIDPDGMLVHHWPTLSDVKDFVGGVGTGIKNFGSKVVNQVKSDAKGLVSAYRNITTNPREALNFAVAHSGPAIILNAAFGTPAQVVKSIAKGDYKTVGEAGGNNLAALGVAGAATLKVGTPSLSTTATETTTLYRGVNSTSPAFEAATEGSATPRGGNATAAEHNAGNTNSEFTSWTTNPEVAKNYALRTSGEGVVMEKTVPNSSMIESPNSEPIFLKQSPGVQVSESEVLLKGNITGAKTTQIKE